MNAERSSLFDALAERWLDPENDDPAEWTDEMLLKHIEDLVGEGWYHAGKAEELLAAYRKRFVEDYVKGCSPSPGLPVEWFEERGHEAMERFEEATTNV